MSSQKHENILNGCQMWYHIRTTIQEDGGSEWHLQTPNNSNMLRHVGFLSLLSDFSELAPTVWTESEADVTFTLVPELRQSRGLSSCTDLFKCHELNTPLQLRPNRIMRNAIKKIWIRFFYNLTFNFSFYWSLSFWLLSQAVFSPQSWLTLYFEENRVNWANMHMGRIGSNANLSQRLLSDYIWHVKSAETDSSRAVSSWALVKDSICTWTDEGCVSCCICERDMVMTKMRH